MTFSSVVKDYSVVDKAYTGTEIGKMGELGEKIKFLFERQMVR